ncbi:hypothetical protein BpHYR1_017776 [Brachionus plicatilis]|uniref:Uncharacterized protein n=1 Tax=Brachionus plicatilis TaxID=10195 RepID=A0A3M7QJS7_BRAPC|nr:hypothetical protein BpHYR1_017776 [Brachionus plicatilis]
MVLYGITVSRLYIVLGVDAASINPRLRNFTFLNVLLRYLEFTIFYSCLRVQVWTFFFKFARSGFISKNLYTHGLSNAIDLPYNFNIYVLQSTRFNPKLLYCDDEVEVIDQEPVSVNFNKGDLELLSKIKERMSDLSKISNI